MKLKRIEIEHFGKLSKFSLNLSEGLNFIYGNNEDGKTTLMAFLKLMFYSNVTATRDLTNLRKRYKPWDGSTMGGAVSFESDGLLYRCQKAFGQTAGKDVVDVLCLTTGEKILLPKDEEVGQHFFHLELDGFERSVFVGQTGAIHKKDGQKADEITERLTNLSTSAEEGVSLLEAQKHLTEAIERLVSKRGNAGLLVESTKDLSELMEKLRERKELEAQQKDLREELDYLIALQKAERERLLGMRQKSKEEQTLEEELFEDTKHYQELRERLLLSEANTQNQKEIFELKFKTESEKLLELSLSLDKKEKKKSKPLFGIFGVSMALITILLSFFVSVFFLFLLVPTGVLLTLEINRQGREKRYRENQRDVSLRVEAQKRELEELTFSYEENKKRGEEVHAKLLDDTKAAQKQMERKQFRLEEIRLAREPERKLEEEIINREAAIAKLRGRIRTPEQSIGELLERIEQEKTVQKERQLMYDSLKLALQVLQESAEELRQNFGPMLSKRTEEIFGRLTKNRYKGVMVAKDFSVSVLPTDDLFYREGGYLSNGTLDQVTLSLRMAIVELLCRNDDLHLPMLFDDIFEQYDETRAEDGLEFLAEYTKNDKEQVLFFTCHRYLFDKADRLQIKANYVTL